MTCWEYLALPGGLAYFVDGQLYLSTRRYLRGKDYDELERCFASANSAPKKTLCAR